MHQIIDIRVSPEVAASLESESEGSTHLLKLCSEESGVPISEIKAAKILKRSLDARSKRAYFNLRIEFSNVDDIAIPEFPYHPTQIGEAEEVHIIGAGPAGLFCALELIQLGLKPILIERGKTVRERRRDLAKLNKEQIVNPDSNYCFGEGGAGTYSDGKLYTRSKKRGEVDRILLALVQFGAKEDILVDAHPHIGTNKLPQLIENIREYIIASGGEIHFETRLTDLALSNGKIKSITVNGDQSIAVKNLVLATGHSARDIFKLLHLRKVKIEAKPFALGVRVEHPQALINEIQYGKHFSDYLPPASYRLVQQVENKGVYSFCMCPGGIIAPCATQAAEIVTNGWSPSRRNNPFANSGMVVEINEKDWQKYRSEGPLAALLFQSEVERNAYHAVNRNPAVGQKAPAQNLVDFVHSKTSGELATCSYYPGIVEHPLQEILPQVVSESLKSAFQFFGKKMRGYLTKDANVVGVESRTSSPVKIPRDPIRLQHEELINLYPSGEGAGYAGGIVSAAIDGIRVANAIKVNAAS